MSNEKLVTQEINEKNKNSLEDKVFAGLFGTIGMVILAADNYVAYEVSQDFLEAGADMPYGPLMLAGIYNIIIGGALYIGIKQALKMRRGDEIC